MEKAVTHRSNATWELLKGDLSRRGGERAPGIKKREEKVGENRGEGGGTAGMTLLTASGGATHVKSGHEDQIRDKGHTKPIQ